MIKIPESLDELDFYAKEPFFLFEKNNFLDYELFKQLDETFPKDVDFEKSFYGKGGKKHIENKGDGFSRFIENNPCWKSFYEEISSPNVLTQLFNLWSLSELPDERQDYYKNPWVYSPYNTKVLIKAHKAVLRLIKKNSVRLGFEFSRIPSGGYIPPHTDIGKKLLSLLIYFPDEGVDYKGTAGTSFFKVKNNFNAMHSWHSNLLNEEQSKKFYNSHDEFYRSEFTPNKLIGFAKTSLTWHTVEPFQIKNATRRSLCINIFTK